MKTTVAHVKPTVIPQIAECSLTRRSPDDGEMVNLPVFWIYIEIDGVRYDHYAIVDSYEVAERLADRVFRARLPVSHFTTSPHWSLWTNPYAGDLEPFGPAWEDEQRERYAA